MEYFLRVPLFEGEPERVNLGLFGINVNQNYLTFQPTKLPNPKKPMHSKPLINTQKLSSLFEGVGFLFWNHAHRKTLKDVYSEQLLDLPFCLNMALLSDFSFHRYNFQSFSSVVFSWNVKLAKSLWVELSLPM